MDLELDGKVVLVTGASKGIGLAVAQAFLSEGAHVVTTSRTRTADLDALVERGAEAVIGDITAETAPQDAVSAALHRFGRLDVLVNNVGSATARPGFLEIDDDEWQRVFGLTFFSAVRSSRAALPALLDGGGSIVNIGSINGWMPFPLVVDYSTAKAALNCLTVALSEEFSAGGVRVNSVSPGPVPTPLWLDPGGFAHAFAEQAGTTVEDAMHRVIPESMGVATGRPSSVREVADAVLFLASPRSGNTTGTDLLVDGGMLKSF